MVLFEILSLIKDTKDLSELKKSRQILLKTLSAIDNRIDTLEQEQLRFELKSMLKQVVNK